VSSLTLTPLVGLSFLNPFLLWGVGLAAIPLIIHILNRRRYRIVRWAAMEFLLKAFQENRRRVRFEQLLLLLLRMAVVALLALLLSRPKASADDLGGLVRRTVHHVFLLDESGSMSEQIAAGSCYDAGRQHVLARLEDLVRERGGDLVTVWRSSSSKPEFLARPVSLKLLTDVKDVLGSAQPTPDRLDLAASLERLGRAWGDVERAAGSKPDAHWVYVVSDFRGADLMTAEGKLDEALVKELRQLDLARLVLMPCGKTAGSNLAVTDVALEDPRVVKGQPVHFAVTVENLGQSASPQVELGLEVDGSSRLTRSVPSLAPQAKHVERFRVAFREAGSHFVSASLPKDRIPIDDRRSFAFGVAESAKVLLVDGEPGESDETAETFFLATALDPTGNSASGLELTRIVDSELGDRDLGAYDYVVMANVASVDEPTLQKIESWVQSGGGLALFTGDQVDAESWNKLFWREGKGLLPAPLKDIAGDMDKPDKVAVAEEPHAVFGELHSELTGLLAFADVGRYHLTGSAADKVAEGAVPDGTTVLLRVGHPAGPALCCERTFGKGRVALVTTTADASWGSLPGNYAYLILMRQLADHLMRREDLSPFNLGPRGAFSWLLPAADYRSEVRLLAAREEDEGLVPERGYTLSPRADQPDLLSLEATAGEGRPWPMAGVYRLVLARTSGPDASLYFGVHSWPQEGRPEMVEGQTLVAALPAELRDKVAVVESTQTAQAGLLTDEGEIWRFLAFIVLAGLMIETVLAWRFGRH
jgi:hypothetical protein